MIPMYSQGWKPLPEIFGLGYSTWTPHNQDMMAFWILFSTLLNAPLYKAVLGEQKPVIPWCSVYEWKPFLVMRTEPEKPDNLLQVSQYTVPGQMHNFVFFVKNASRACNSRLPARPFAGIPKLSNRKNYQVCSIIVNCQFLVLLLHQ